MSFGTFYQPWRESLCNGPETWHQWMSELRATGVQRLIVQWVSWDSDWVLVASPGQTGDDAAGADHLRSIMAAAQPLGISVWLGLDGSGSMQWGQRIQSPDDKAVRSYLDSRLLVHRSVAQALAAATDHGAFGGWYLPDELEDLHWRSPTRATMMGAYLKSLTDIVHQVAPHAPIATSAFAWHSRITPAEWAELLTAWFDAAPLLTELLMQDGVGTEANTVAQAQALQAASDTAAAGHERRCTPVIELFEPDGVICKDPPFRTAPVARIEQQMAAADADGREVVGFSVPEYVTRACDRNRALALRRWLEARAERHVED